VNQRKLPIVVVVVLLLSIGFYLLSPRMGRGDGDEFGGTLEATQYTLGSPLGGMLEEVTVGEGQKVQAGTQLAVIKHNELMAEKKALESQLEVARAQLKEGEIKVANARLTLQRLRGLKEAGSVTRQRIDDSDARTREAEAMLQGARAGVQRITHQLESLDERIAYATIKAPAAGTVLRVNYESGELVPPGGGVVTLADLSRMWVRIYVSGAMLAKVKLGGGAKIHVDGLPQQAYAGKVSWIANEAEFTPKNVQTKEDRVRLVYAVKVTLERADGALKIGMPADVELQM
jgi:HlyD family secretion protein